MTDRRQTNGRVRGKPEIDLSFPTTDGHQKSTPKNRPPHPHARVLLHMLRPLPAPRWDHLQEIRHDGVGGQGLDEETPRTLETFRVGRPEVPVEKVRQGGVVRVVLRDAGTTRRRAVTPRAGRKIYI